MDIDAVRRLMAKKCRALGSQRAFARLAGVHAQALSHVLKGRRDPTPDMLAVVGIERFTGYRRKREHEGG